MAIRPGQVVTSSGNGGGGGGGSVTLATITGTLGTLKGGTGLNATDLGDLRQKLGIANPSNPSDEYLDYCADTRHQPNNTIQRVDTSTSNSLSGVADGLIVKVGDDQVMINLADGKQWVRSHTESGRTAWSTPENANLTEIQSEAQIRGMLDGSVAYTSQTAWLPQYPDNTRPSKVIIARVGEYLIACARYNMWWAPRPTVSTWSEVPWRWEGNSQVPQGLEFSGGVNDEDRIPAGAVAVLGNKENVDQDSAGYILLMTKHTFDSAMNISTYTGYFVDDDSDKTIKRSTSTIGLATTHWGRVKVDIDGIADTIITADRGSGDPVFHGIIPEISNLEFPGYTRVASTSGMSAGDVYYNDTSRTMYVVHQAQDTHLGDLFNSDFEVELHKDDSNFIRGVFSTSASLPDVTGAVYRAEDLITQGTIATGDTIEIRGHKSVVTKTDRILPVNLGLSHGANEAGKLVGMDSTGSTFSLLTDNGLPAAARIPSSVTTKTSTLEVIVSGSPTADQVRINSGSGIAVNVSGGDATNLSTMISNAITNEQWLLVVKDSTNYIAIKPTASTISSGSVSSIGERLTSRIQRGTISAGDSVQIWLRPDNAGKHIIHDFLGEHIVIEPERPHLIYARQTSGITNGFASGTNTTWLNFNTPAWKMPDGFKIGSHIEVSANGVTNFGAGGSEQVVPQMALQARAADTLVNLTGATWRTVDGVPGLQNLFFRSKVASGTTSSGDDSNRDYWSFASKPMPMSVLHSDIQDGRYVSFRIGVNRSDSDNENFTNIYGFDLTIRVWPGSLVTTS